MIVTEKGTKDLLCPQPDFRTCKASGCMAWRWEDNDKGLRDAEKPRKGFCGMAGYPMEVLDD